MKNTLLIFAVLLVASFAKANEPQAAMAHYRIKVENLSRGQALSPPLLSFHRSGVDLFQMGKPASQGLAILAEDGKQDLLRREIMIADAGARIQVGTKAIKPGVIMVYEMKVPASLEHFSFATMLVTTNDGFTGASNLKVSGAATEFYASAYDAGSEANTESCRHVPGPPCSAHGVRVRAGSEGVVQVHLGIQGIRDIDKQKFDWQNPIARIKIERM